MKGEGVKIDWEKVYPKQIDSEVPAFKDGYILVGHPSGGSYGQFYYYIMSSSLACKKTHETRQTCKTTYGEK